MAKVKVLVSTMLATYMGGKREHEVNASNIRELLKKLSEDYGQEVRNRLLEVDGSMRRFINIFVNNKNVRTLNDVDTELKDGDEVIILPAVSGGIGFYLTDRFYTGGKVSR